MSSSDSERAEPKYQGGLSVPAILNQVFFVSPDGTKQIIVGHRVEKNFPVSIRFYKLSHPLSGIEFTVSEWREIVSAQSDIKSYLNRGVRKPSITLGSKERAVEFSKYMSKRTVVFSEINPPEGFHPRQIALQENNWSNLQAAFRAIDECINLAELTADRVNFIFHRICDRLKPYAANLDGGFQSKLAELSCAEVLADFMNIPTPDDRIIFTQLQHSCKSFIFNSIIEENTGVHVPGGF